MYSPNRPLSYQAFIAFCTLYAAVISLPPYHNCRNFASSSNWLEALLQLLRRLLRQFDRQSRAMVPLVGPDTIFHCEAVALLQFNSFGQHHGKFIYSMVNDGSPRILTRNVRKFDCNIEHCFQDTLMFGVFAPLKSRQLPKLRQAPRDELRS